MKAYKITQISLTTQLILFTFLSVSTYAALAYLRSRWSPYGCHLDPSSCIPFPTNLIDYWTSTPFIRAGEASTYAERLSTRLQNLSGLVAWLIPCFLILYPSLKKRNRSRLKSLINHSFLFLQVAFWNGVGIELSHIFIPRMRPYGFQDLNIYGKQLSNFTSFYSGHTSFTAASLTFLILSLIDLKSPRWLTIAFFLISQATLLTTGFLRVTAGKHYFSDVIVGAVMGCFTALMITNLWKNKNSNFH